jgi:hypothetical protein
MKKAFKMVADLLVGFTRGNAHERDSLVWPIVFCYRQYVELVLKDAIAEYGPQMKNACAPLNQIGIRTTLENCGHPINE